MLLHATITLAFFIRVMPESKDDDSDDEEGPGLTKKKKKAKTGKRGARKRAEAEAKAGSTTATEGDGDATAAENGGAPSQEALFKKANDAKNEVKLKEALEVQRQDRMAQVTTQYIWPSIFSKFDSGESRRFKREKRRS